VLTSVTALPQRLLDYHLEPFGLDKHPPPRLGLATSDPDQVNRLSI
jgi:hypothetical protein